MFKVQCMAFIYHAQQIHPVKFQAEIKRLKISHIKMESIHAICTAFMKI